MKRPPADADPYLAEIDKHWDAIVGMYRAFEHRKPMIELNVTSGKILAYSAKEYLEELGDRTRDQTKQRYRKTIREGGIMVFVRDESKQVLTSYAFPAACVV